MEKIFLDFSKITKSTAKIKTRLGTKAKILKWTKKLVCNRTKNQDIKKNIKIFQAFINIRL